MRTTPSARSWSIRAAVSAGPVTCGRPRFPRPGFPAGPAGKPCRRNQTPLQVTGPADTAALIDQLRADGVVLAYDPSDRTLRAGDAPSVTIGRDTTATHPRRDKERRTA